ncbi:DUF4411 family protein [Cytobacillus oceanisediminis]
MTQDGLFDDPAKYAIDTNVIVSFLGDSDSEHYPMDVFKPQWNFLEKAMQDGRVVAPAIVAVELEKWTKNVPAIKTWLHDQRYLFHEIASDGELAVAKAIVNAFPAYASSVNYVGDLEVMAFAHARGLSVISLELKATQHSVRKPKIPNVCEKFGIPWVSLAGFLRAEGFA